MIEWSSAGKDGDPLEKGLQGLGLRIPPELCIAQRSTKGDNWPLFPKLPPMGITHVILCVCVGGCGCVCVCLWLQRVQSLEVVLSSFNLFVSSRWYLVKLEPDHYLSFLAVLFFFHNV